MSDLQLYNLISMDTPQDVLAEVLVIMDLISPGFDTVSVRSAFNTTVSLYKGTYPGYRACNTEYHDLHHTIDTFLAMARLIHGAVLNGENFTDRQVALGLITALLHDAGYIQKEQDTDGTGSKYTANHVQRSMNFLARHGSEFGLSPEEITDGQAIILCTDLSVDISAVPLPSAKVELLGKILGSADLLAQMADRTYLEKLLFLYYEFREAGIGDYQSETDLLQKTLSFYDFIAQRLETALDSTDRFSNAHFASRWKTDANLYHVAIEKQRNYLSRFLKVQDFDFRDYLRRGGITDRVQSDYQDKPS